MRALADEEPGWQPGTRFGYHAKTFGFLVGEMGMNGSAAYADIDSGVSVAVMRNCFDADLTAVAQIDQIVAENLS